MPNEWVDVKISGLDELQEKLESLPEKLANKTLRGALMDGARIMVSAFMAFAPRLAKPVPGIPSGFLAENFNIHLSMRKQDLAGSAYVGPIGKMDYPDRDTGGYRVKVNSKGRKRNVGRIAVASVARFLEFGVGGGKHRHPFMTPAWESHKQIILDRIIEGLKEGLEELA